MSEEKSVGTIWILICYAIALASGYSAFNQFGAETLVRSSFGANIVATLIVFGFSVAFRNASFFDAYWSAMPVAFFVLWKYQIGGPEWNPIELFFGVIVLLWAVRLTLNWYRGWSGMEHEDWRYVDFKERYAALYPLVNLIGIHLVPSIAVFLGCLPLIGFFRGLELFGGVLTGVQMTIFSIGCVVATVGPLLQWLADEQMRDHRQLPEPGPISEGLWRYSRHPNYFGELLFWLGMGIVGASTGAAEGWMVLGFIVLTLLVFFLSIPIMEAHLVEKYPDYRRQQAEVSVLIPWVRSKSEG